MAAIQYFFDRRTAPADAAYLSRALRRRHARKGTRGRRTARRMLCAVWFKFELALCTEAKDGNLNTPPIACGGEQ